MIPELGHFALIIALCLALLQAFFALYGAHKNRYSWMALSRPAAAGHFVFVLFSFVLLIVAFLQNDFSVLYVAQNSNSALPWGYRIAAVWGAHEGSLLLWILLLAIWTIAVAAFSRGLPLRFASRVIGVLGFVSIGFMLFTLATSNPFLRLIPAAVDGQDLNPLLQDPALVIHPPILYAGYVGLSVAFAFAIAAMLEGRLDQAWARWTRPWTNIAWVFLTVGIALGSWWAYYELGWGGWWFWDPVENASFMPWLAGAALIHSLAVTETRGLFKSWTLLLAISAFSLSLLGTFLVRSGVIVSVHAFATDPARGVFILAFLTICIGGALALYAWRAPQLKSDAGFALLSRETFILLNNMLLVIAAALILLGTLYPLFIDALELGKISVGPPYFNLVFLVPMLPLALLVGIGMHGNWKRADGFRLWQRLRWPALVAIVAGLMTALFIYSGSTAISTIGIVTAMWVMISALIIPLSHRRRSGRFSGISRGMVGMVIAHFGIGLFILGATVTSTHGVEEDIALEPGQTIDVEGYEFTFRGLRDVQGPNYQAVEAEVEVRRNARQVAILTPQKRVYRVQKNAMTEAGIDAGWSRDLFVALGEPLGENRWSVRIQYKPLIRFIWLGALFMAFGGIVASTDKRYRSRARAKIPSAAAGETAR